MTHHHHYGKNLQLGSLNLSSNILYAPLAGCSDYPFRMMSARYSPGLMYCEMVKMDALVRENRNTLRMLDYHPSMHPIGAQLCGSKPEIAGQTAKMLENMGFDVIDLNCGCPVDKVTKDGSGSGMLKTPNLIGDVLANIVAAVKVPVTVKIRAGWDEDNIVAAEITRIAEQAGARAICIHGRTRKQAYKGPANWDYIKACKEAAGNIKIIGNGDAVDGASAARMMEYTGCDAVLVARGTMGQPWIADDIRSYLTGVEPVKRSVEECRQALYEHFCITREYHPDAPLRTVIDMRRVGCWYLKKSSGTRAFRELISKTTNIEDVERLILDFPLHPIQTEEKNESEDECESE